MVESTRVSFDLHSWAEGSDSAHSVTDGFDTFSSDSEESSLPLLQQLIQGDALKWKPNFGDDILLDSEFQGLFTSGTGGDRKLVFHTQREVIAHAKSVAECCKLSRKDVWLHVAPIAHAMDSFALYACVFAGATQVTMGSTAFNAQKTIETIKREGVTAMALTRTHLQILLHEPSFCTSCAQATNNFRRWIHHSRRASSAVSERVPNMYLFHRLRVHRSVRQNCDELGRDIPRRRVSVPSRISYALV